MIVDVAVIVRYADASAVIGGVPFAPRVPITVDAETARRLVGRNGIRYWHAPLTTPCDCKKGRSA